MHNFSYTITLTAMNLYSQKNMVYSVQIEIDVLFVLLTMSEFVLLTMSEFCNLVVNRLDF